MVVTRLNMNLSRATAGVLLVAGIGLASCSSEEGGGAEGCTVDSECKGNRICNDGACVQKALSGLVLDPGDANNGDATFTYQFTPGAPAAS